MSLEIVLMFIRNCTNLDLSNVFRCKTISKWSAEKVQEAIDEYERDHKSWRLVCKNSSYHHRKCSWDSAVGSGSTA